MLREGRDRGRESGSDDGLDMGEGGCEGPRGKRMMKMSGSEIKKI